MQIWSPQVHTLHPSWACGWFHASLCRSKQPPAEVSNLRYPSSEPSAPLLLVDPLVNSKKANFFTHIRIRNCPFWGTLILWDFHQLQKRSWENVDDNDFLSQNPRTELLEPLLWEDPLVSPTKAILYADRSNGVTSSGDLSILGFIVSLNILKTWCFILFLSLCMLLGGRSDPPSTAMV